MNFLKLSALMVAGVLATACASVSQESVDQIIASNLAARGGKERIQGLRSIRATGTMTGPGGRVAHIVREIKRPGLFRFEFTFQGATSVFAHDGTGGWQIAPLQGQFEPSAVPPELDAAGSDDQLDIEGPLVNWKQKGHVVTLLDRQRLDGKEVFKLKTELRGGGIRYDYIDVASRQVVRSDATRIIQGRATVLETSFSDFRTVGGLAFPHSIEMRQKDRPQVLNIAVDSIELNPTLDDSRFQMPR
jgi:outer membrane lipoprotein-sorting protein